MPMIVLRSPRREDEAEVRAAQAEMDAEGFDFMLAENAESWLEYLREVDLSRRGEKLAPGRVPATMLLAVAGDQIIGRVHIRHALTPSLLRVGGHIGYAVRPAHRRQGYATEILNQGLHVLDRLGVPAVLVTCDDDNAASIRTIVANGGVLENTEMRSGEVPKRRYWITKKQ